ncbi:MAG: hypothetical protein ACP5NU_03690 [Methanomicrobiales archaeon]
MPVPSEGFWSAENRQKVDNGRKRVCRGRFRSGISGRSGQFPVLIFEAQAGCFRNHAS